MFGEADRLGAGDTQGQFLLGLIPSRDLLDLNWGELPAGIDPRSLLRTKAFKSLIERVRSLVMESRAVTKIREPWRNPSFRR